MGAREHCGCARFGSTAAAARAVADGCSAQRLRWKETGMLGRLAPCLVETVARGALLGQAAVAAAMPLCVATRAATALEEGCPRASMVEVLRTG